MENSEYHESNFVGFSHNIFPDITFTHIPKITFVSYGSNFGGLMGMWLGLSLLDIFNYFYNKVSMIFQKSRETNTSINLNINKIIIKEGNQRKRGFISNEYNCTFNRKYNGTM